jgi:hypothetical protein
VNVQEQVIHGFFDNKLSKKKKKKKKKAQQWGDRT